jgi:hypothetical protein
MSRNISLLCQSSNNNHITGFSYIRRGYYYLSGKGTLIKGLENLQTLHPGADRNGDIVILKADYQVWYVLFCDELCAPPSLSVGGVAGTGFVRGEVLLGH